MGLIPYSYRFRVFTLSPHAFRVYFVCVVFRFLCVDRGCVWKHSRFPQVLTWSPGVSSSRKPFVMRREDLDRLESPSSSSRSLQLDGLFDKVEMR